MDTVKDLEFLQTMSKSSFKKRHTIANTNNLEVMQLKPISRKRNSSLCPDVKNKFDSAESI